MDNNTLQSRQHPDKTDGDMLTKMIYSSNKKAYLHKRIIGSEIVTTTLANTVASDGYTTTINFPSPVFPVHVSAGVPNCMSSVKHS